MFLVLVAWIAIGAAGFYIFDFQKKILSAADGVRGVDRLAREAADALGEIRLAQQAYVASGQGVAFWMPKVAERTTGFNNALNALRASAIRPAAQSAADDAAAAMKEFVEVDRRARDYIRAGQLLMASDVIFSEAGQLAAVAARQVETARQAERQEFDAEEAQLRRSQAVAAGGATGLTALVLLVLGLAGGRPAPADDAAREGFNRTKPSISLSVTPVSRDGDEGIVSHAKAVSATAQRAPAPAAGVATPVATRNASMLKAAADLATDFGQIRDSAELERLLARASDLLDAAGLVVWLAHGNNELRPALVHGYTPQVLARMQSIPKTADNAAAAAFRTGSLQIVLSRPGGTAGAIVAPILSAPGCIGALSAEIKGGGEGSEAVQAVAAIVAAQLANVLAMPPVESEPVAQEARAAQA
jgi:hypothetical protein